MRGIASYTVVAAASALLVLNPVVVYLVSGSRSLAAFALVLDVWLALIGAAGASITCGAPAAPASG